MMKQCTQSTTKLIPKSTDSESLRLTTTPTPETKPPSISKLETNSNSNHNQKIDETLNNEFMESLTKATLRYLDKVWLQNKIKLKLKLN